VSTWVWAQGDSLRVCSASFFGNSIQVPLRFWAATAELSASSAANTLRDVIAGLDMWITMPGALIFSAAENHFVKVFQYSSFPSYIISETLNRLLIFTFLPASVAKRTSPLSP